MCKKNCLGCQFWCVYGDHEIQGRWERAITKKERVEISEKKNFCCVQGGDEKCDYRTYICCHKRVWDEYSYIRKISRKANESQFSDDDLGKLKNVCWEAVVETNRSYKNSRGNSCFYFKYQEGMSLEAADELEKRETIQKDAAADRRWIKVSAIATAIATSVAAIALVLNFFVN